MEIAGIKVSLGLDMSEFNKGMSEVSDKLSNMGSKLLGAGASLTAGITAPLFGVSAAAIKVSEDLNMAQLSFTTMLGSAEKATAFLNELKDFAAKTPFEFPDLVEASKRMMAMGFAANQVVPTLRIIGDSVAALGGGKDMINGVTTALGQMQAKGKVSAEEMAQLAERGIPSWQLLADAIGVTVPEAMKLAEKGAITAAQAVPAILDGMNQKFGGQMSKASETLTGVWSNFKDQVTMTLADLGNILAPTLKSIVEAAAPLLAWAKDAVTWFGQLPAPIQGTVLVVAALAAAIGPLLVAAGALASGIGAIAGAIPVLTAGFAAVTGALTAPVLAVAAVTAALAALGAWVYSNWDSITATVAQAWDGISELWSAVWSPIQSFITGVWGAIASAASTVWNPIASFFATLWDGIAPYFSSAWNGISSAMSAIWNGIKSVATSVWSAITGAIGSFLEAAAKIPGVNKLINLDDAWSSAKKASDEIKSAATATNTLATSAKNAAGGTSAPIPKLVTGIKDVGKAAKETEDRVKPLRYENDLLNATVKIQTAEYNKNIAAVAAAKLKLAELGDTVGQMIQPSDALTESIQKMSGNLDNLSKHSTPAFLTDLANIKTSTGDLSGAFKTLGITSETEYGKTAAEAKKAYDAISGSGIATPTEKNNAMLAMMKAQRAEMVSNGEQIPKDMQAMIAKMDAAAIDPSTGMPKVKSRFTDFGKEVSTVITNLSQDLVKGLFEGDGSFADRGLSALKSLGEAVVSKFTEPFAKAATDLISGAITDLLGGKGFGGILDSVKNIGKSVSDVFGGSGSTVSSGTGGISGGTGGTGSGVGGAMGVANLVTGIATAISSIVGNFQMAKMETSLNGIELNTRRGTLFLGDRGDQGILGQAFRIADTLEFGTLVKCGEAIRDTTAGIKNDTYWLLTKVDELYWSIKAIPDILSVLNDIKNTPHVTQVSITVNGAQSPSATASEIQRKLMAQNAY